MSSREGPADVASGLAPHVAGRPPAKVRLPETYCGRCDNRDCAVTYCDRHTEPECDDCARNCGSNGNWIFGWRTR